MTRITAFAALIAGVFLVGFAFAHSVGTDAYVVDGGTVIQVEAWLAGGVVPKTGSVVVLAEDGGELLKGDLQDGIFRFTPNSKQRFRFIVSLGEGHMKDFTISDKQLAKLTFRGAGESLVPVSPGAPAASSPPVRYGGRDEGRVIDRAILGVLLILTITSLAVLARMSERLRRLEDRISAGKGKDRGPSSS